MNYLITEDQYHSLSVRRRSDAIEHVVDNLMENMYVCDYENSNHFLKGVSDELFYYYQDVDDLKDLPYPEIVDFLFNGLFHHISGYWEERCGLNQHKHMFKTVTIKNNFDESSTEEPLNEIERDWRDKDYTDEYPKFRDRMLPIFDNLVKSYGEDDKGNLALFNDDEGTKTVINYRSIPKELYYDNSFSQYFTDYLPYHMWARHGKYLVYDYFKSQFPDVEVKYVTPANIL